MLRLSCISRAAATNIHPQPALDPPWPSLSFPEHPGVSLCQLTFFGRSWAVHWHAPSAASHGLCIIAVTISLAAQTFCYPNTSSTVQSPSRIGPVVNFLQSSGFASFLLGILATKLFALFWSLQIVGPLALHFKGCLNACSLVLI